MATIPPNDIASADALDTAQQFFVNQSGLLKQDTLANLAQLIQNNILVPVANGGTGAATAEEARINLGLGAAAVLDAGIFSGSGTPEGSITSPVGGLYVDTSGGTGSTLYVKESGTGSSGWVAK